MFRSKTNLSPYFDLLLTKSVAKNESMNRHLSKLFLLTTTALIGFSTTTVSAQPYGNTAAKRHRQQLVNAESKSSPDNLQGTLEFKRQSLLLPSGTKQTFRAEKREQQRLGAKSFRKDAPGNVAELPFREGFDNENALTSFTIIDANKDGNTWSYFLDNETGQSAVQMQYGDNSHDDWLITPPLALKANMVYNISYRVASKGISYPELLEVKYGNAATVDAMTNVLVEQHKITNTEYETIKQTFTPTADGVYYFGFHCTSDVDWFWQLILDDISVEGNSMKAPNEANLVSVTAANDGSLKATIDFVAPATAIDGSNLEAPLTIDIMRNGEKIGEMGDIEPNGSYKYVDNEAEQGINAYSVIAKNSLGEGKESKRIEVYVGVDTPIAPTNIQTSQTDDSITLTWDAVTTGSHGGYVKPADVLYNVYEIEETGTGVNLTLVKKVSETSISIPYKTNVGQQDMINYALSSENEVGEGPRVMSPNILVGEPYVLPFEEHFKNGRLDNSMWWVSETDKSTFQLMQGMSSDGDGGCTGYVSVADEDSATMGSGKISIKGAVSPTLVFSNRSSVPNGKGKVIVRIDAPGKETKQLCIVDYANIDNSQQEWHTTSVKLDAEYTALPYITFTFTAQAPTGETVYFDNIYVRDVVEKDLRLSLNAPSKVRKGETITAKVDVRNMGSIERTNYTVRLYAGNDLIDSKVITDPLAPHAQNTVSLKCPTTVVDVSPLSLKAEVITADEDATPDDNVATVNVELLSSTKTAPTNVTATMQTDGKVVIEWQKIEETSEVVTDDFESYTPWATDDFGEWTSVYGEKGVARGPFSRSYPHPNEGKRFAFTLVEPASWLTDKVMEEYTCLRPHSGGCYLASFYSVENSQFIVADNWLISPSLPGKQQEVTFWANNFKSSTLNYPENIELLYSKAGTTIADFIPTSTKVIVDGGVWKQYSATLPEGATYFAIHNNTADTYMLMLDDITYTAGCGKVVAYNIYRGNKLIKRIDADTPSKFTDTEASNNNANYAVSAVYAGGESEATKATPVTDVKSIEINSGKPFDLYTIDGRLVAKDIHSLKGIRKGIYVVNGKTIIKK